MENIKLFICCHKESAVPENALIQPIQVGAALAEARFAGFLQDDTGENISSENRSYCELTAQYWAWKNFDADYYGFFHYRRYLYPRPGEKRPYRIEAVPSSTVLNRLGFREFPALIPRYDLIVPKGEDMHISVREHYQSARYHHGKDLELLERIVRKQYPDDVETMDQYLSGTVQYFGNIYIMRRQIFEDYCAWLFSILEEFDRKADLSGYSAQEKRVDGYLGERLLGIWYTRRKEKLRTAELPGVHFHSGWDGAMKRVVNALLPPGTARRAVAKRFK